MGFWIFVFIVTLVIPASLLLTWYLCPKLKKINNASGYRTKRSMQNQDTWDFAQKYSSKISFYMFFPSLILAITIMPTVGSKSINRIGWIGFGITLIQMMSFIVIMVSTEKALKKSFDESGNKV
uniref:SdpI family protein n=1 Tax=Vaginimicrobium propionicum TaxID=1871034 RepID=UPI000970E349|nr:SdpI family protein [Vaginimicrobium propionicum]